MGEGSGGSQRKEGGWKKDLPFFFLHICVLCIYVFVSHKMCICVFVFCLWTRGQGGHNAEGEEGFAVFLPATVYSWSFAV